MSEFPDTLMIGQLLTRELTKEIERRYNTYVELEQQLATSKEELSRARLQNAIVYGTSHPEMYKTVEDELRKQLAEAEDFCKDEMARSAERNAKLREQVTLLRDALTDAVAALEHRWEVVANRAAPIMESVIDTAHTKGIEALAARPNIDILPLEQLG